MIWHKPHPVHDLARKTILYDWLWAPRSGAERESILELMFPLNESTSTLKYWSDTEAPTL